MTDIKTLKKQYEKIFKDTLEKLMELNQESDSETRLELKCFIKDKVLFWRIDMSEIGMQMYNEHIDIIPKWHIEEEIVKEIEIVEESKK